MFKSGKAVQIQKYHMMDLARIGPPSPQLAPSLIFVDSPGIGPGPRQLAPFNYLVDLARIGPPSPQLAPSLIFVDSPGIGPGPQQCECCVIPFYYEPPLSDGVKMSRLPAGRQVIPLYHRPQKNHLFLPYSFYSLLPGSSIPVCGAEGALVGNSGPETSG